MTRSVTRRNFLGTALGAAAAASMGMTAEGGANRPPNIVIIMADDIGYNDLGSYGQDLFPTPYTDELANQSMRFTDAHTPSAVCSPTRYGVVTGTDPNRRYHTTHVLFNGEPLVIGEEEPTIASLLKKAGYRTGVVGKWHLGWGDDLPRDLNNPGRGPNELGFDYSYCVPDGPDMEPKYYFENGEVVGGTEPPFESEPELITRVGYYLVRHQAVGEWEDRRPQEKIGAHLADKADAFIEDNKDEPFFLYYPTHSIHFPFVPYPRFEGKSGIGVHGDYVMEWDWAVGRVMQTLDRLGLAGNTLLIVTSDNGGYGSARENGGHDPNHPWRGSKGSAFEGGHRVPFFARWPGHIEPGATNDETISLVDLTATVCALADAPLPPRAALDSFNLMPALLNRTDGETIRPYMVNSTRGMEELALRQGPWKLIYNPEEEKAQLYHLADDPGETNNLADEQPGKVNELLDLLTGYIENGTSRPGASGQGKRFEDLFRERDERNERLEEKFGS